MNMGFGEMRASREDVNRTEMFRVGPKDIS